jgi:uncharacterized protein (TIGR02246 family)
MSASAAARAVANAQLVAYNDRDMAAYLALFHDDAVLINLPGQEVIATGLDEIRAMYTARFVTPGLRCVVYHRSEIGPIAIDRETVHTDGQPAVDILAMYEVIDHKIKRIFFIRGGGL